MATRLAKVALYACLLALLPGCVEITQTFTLNPDGKGKVKVEVLVPAYDFDLAMGNGAEKKKEKSLDDLRKEAIIKFMSEKVGVTAWKDVSVSWSRDGRLRMIGTAYFDNLEDLDKEAAAGPKDPTKAQPSSMFKSSLRLVREKDGTLRLTGKNEGVKEGVMKLNEKKEEVDITKLTDKELDDYLLRQRVEYQKIRPLLVLMLSDLKVTMVVHLPGEAIEIKGFKKEGATVKQSIEGNALLGMMKDFIMMDAAEVRKLGAGKDAKDIFNLMAPLQALGEPDVTIRPAAKAQFDYDREVREARAAYPMLRKALGIDSSVKLPGDSDQ
jgi:hypothetical protein